MQPIFFCRHRRRLVRTSPYGGLTQAESECKNEKLLAQDSRDKMVLLMI